MTIYTWEIIVYLSAILSTIGTLTVVTLAGRWIIKTYFPKHEKATDSD
ncbi:MAG: hypothetical protein ACOX4R_02050 [Lentihominibacter sp.]|jgi:hypothetical protein